MSISISSEVEIAPPVPVEMIVPQRKLTGISAVLLPFDGEGNVDWSAFAAHVARTADHGLTPAVNMDTGYINLIDEPTRLKVLDTTRDTLAGKSFVAGAFVADQPGSPFDGDTYKRRVAEITKRGGVPVIFQSFGLVEQPGPEIVESYRKIASLCDQFIGFELTKDLAPFGDVYDLDTYRGLMEIPQCIGAKHSSFHRQPEWERLQLRNQFRPDFKVFTGNDLAIDMVMYGSDYLLGLSTFAPDLFAERDAYWKAGDTRFYELNDQLQYLGFLAFRRPAAGYKHSAAQFLKLRGWINSSQTHPDSPKRPESDVALFQELAIRMEILKG